MRCASEATIRKLLSNISHSNMGDFERGARFACLQLLDFGLEELPKEKQVLEKESFPLFNKSYEQLGLFKEKE